MIETVGWQDSTFLPPPLRFQAGTARAGVIGLAAAIEYLEQFGWAQRRAHEQALLDRLLQALLATEGVRVLRNQPRTLRLWFGAS